MRAAPRKADDLAASYARVGRFHEARQILERLRTVSPVVVPDVISVAGVIEPALQAAETARSANRTTRRSTAYDLYLRALAHYRSCEKNRITEAIDLLEQAIERDPS